MRTNKRIIAATILPLLMAGCADGDREEDAENDYYCRGNALHSVTGALGQAGSTVGIYEDTVVVWRGFSKLADPPEVPELDQIISHHLDFATWEDGELLYRGEGASFTIDEYTLDFTYIQPDHAGQNIVVNGTCSRAVSQLAELPRTPSWLLSLHKDK